MSNKKVSRIDIIASNGNTGEHYAIVDQQILDKDDVILTEGWYDAINEDDEDEKL
ncbi:MAG: hypothetical protein JKY52_09655 [Flavobacteriales bacterium]|nr:hypothetical protein [Flavobacteriales bacterium]